MNRGSVTEAVIIMSPTASAVMNGSTLTPQKRVTVKNLHKLLCIMHYRVDQFTHKRKLPVAATVKKSMATNSSLQEGHSIVVTSM